VRLSNATTSWRASRGRPVGQPHRLIEPGKSGRRAMASLHRDKAKREERKIPASEQRRGIDHRLRRTGTIAFAGSGHDCTVRNISGTGASLDISDRVSIPPHRFNDPVRVVAFNALEHWSKDVSVEIQTRCACHGVPMPEHIRDFIERHTLDTAAPLSACLMASAVLVRVARAQMDL
jgi:hypothetical protein